MQNEIIYDFVLQQPHMRLIETLSGVSISYNHYKEKRKELTKQITPLRKRLKQAEKIWDKSPHLLELVKQEQSLETQAKQRIKNKEWSR